jgi:cytochrome c-type protein NapB
LALAIVLAAACLTEETTESVEADDLGLSKASVFSTPTPVVAVNTAKEPGENAVEAAYFSESPPMIPHVVEDYLPIRLDDNMCLECHQLRDQVGQEPAPGDPTPVPASHYTDQRRDPGVVKDEVTPAQLLCTLCHAPQTDANPLVANTYTQ